jgi:hypothetical protein
MRLVIIAVLALIFVYAVAVVAAYVDPLLRYLAARYGFSRRRPAADTDVRACPHRGPMTDAAAGPCPLCTPALPLEAGTPPPAPWPDAQPGAPERTHDSPADRVLLANAEWLMARWAEAERGREQGESRRFPPWHFDAPTERQLQQLRDAGLTFRLPDLTRGQASDILGLFEPVEPENKDILHFFDIPSKELNRSRARHEVAQLLADPQNLRAWNQRPADTLQKEFFRFFGLDVPPELTCRDAEVLIREHRAKLEEEGTCPLLDEWDAFESICAELLDLEAGETYDIRRPSLTVIQSAVEALRKDGRTLAELAGDVPAVVDRLVELAPELRTPDD